MKKKKEDIPLHYYERNMLFVGFFAAISAILSYFTYKYYIDINPRAFILGIPTIIISFQTLWLVLNPCAVIYEDKFEIKRTLLSNKFWYFIDISSVEELGSGGFEIVYNDGEREKVSTFGIRGSHQKTFRDMVNKYVCKSVVERD